MSKYVHSQLKTLIIFLAVPNGKALHKSILCLHFSYKTGVFSTHILIGCSYCWLHPVKTLTSDHDNLVNAAKSEGDEGVS